MKCSSSFIPFSLAADRIDNQRLNSARHATLRCCKAVFNNRGLDESLRSILNDGLVECLASKCSPT
jgi:hypothetical protein